jgi:hypothetical protein
MRTSCILARVLGITMHTTSSCGQCPVTSCLVTCMLGGTMHTNCFMARVLGTTMHTTSSVTCRMFITFLITFFILITFFTLSTFLIFITALIFIT